MMAATRSSAHPEVLAGGERLSNSSEVSQPRWELTITTRVCVLPVQPVNLEVRCLLH